MKRGVCGDPPEVVRCKSLAQTGQVKERVMSEDPNQASKDAFERLPLKKQLVILLGPWWGRAGTPAEWPWLSQGVAQAYLQRISIEETVNLTKETSRLTKWLIDLTWVLIGLGIAGILAAGWFWSHPRL